MVEVENEASRFRGLVGSAPVLIVVAGWKFELPAAVESNPDGNERLIAGEDEMPFGRIGRGVPLPFI